MKKIGGGTELGLERMSLHRVKHTQKVSEHWRENESRVNCLIIIVGSRDGERSGLTGRKEASDTVRRENTAISSAPTHIPPPPSPPPPSR